jgi:hypothetical protein
MSSNWVGEKVKVGNRPEIRESDGYMISEYESIKLFMGTHPDDIPMELTNQPNFRASIGFLIPTKDVRGVLSKLFGADSDPATNGSAELTLKGLKQFKDAAKNSSCDYLINVCNAFEAKYRELMGNEGFEPLKGAQIITYSASPESGKGIKFSGIVYITTHDNYKKLLDEACKASDISIPPSKLKGGCECYNTLMADVERVRY